jgi:hypothetical protein
VVRTPNFVAIDLIAAHSDGYSLRCSSTMRTARSRSSAGYLPCLLIAPSSQGMESLAFPGRFKLAAHQKLDLRDCVFVEAGLSLRNRQAHQPNPQGRAFS